MRENISEENIVEKVVVTAVIRNPFHLLQEILRKVPRENLHIILLHLHLLHLQLTTSNHTTITINVKMTMIIVTITNTAKTVTGLETIITVIDMMKRSILEKNCVDEVVIGVIMMMIAITTILILMTIRIRISVTMIIIIVTRIIMQKIVTGLRTTSIVTTFGMMESILVERIVVTVVTTVVVVRIIGVVVTPKASIIGVNPRILVMTSIGHQIVMTNGKMGLTADLIVAVVRVAKVRAKVVTAKVSQVVDTMAAKVDTTEAKVIATTEAKVEKVATTTLILGYLTIVAVTTTISGIGRKRHLRFVVVLLMLPTNQQQ